MSLRASLYALIERHELDAATSRRLMQLAALTREPEGLALWLPRGLAVLAAALTGLGVVLWVAANWDTMGRLGHFALLQVLVFTACVAAQAWPAARAPLGLLALLAIGGLFAYFGQTYQTGADPWQLFALWAALALPLAWAVRSDIVWAPWSLVAMVAVSLWTQAHTGHAWRVQRGDLPAHAMAFAATAAVVLAMSALARRLTGAGLWALRTAATLAVVMVTLAAMGGLFATPVALHYPLGLLVLAAMAGVFSRRAQFDVYVLSAVAFGGVSLLVAGVARLLFESAHAEPIGAMLLVGLMAMGLLAAAVSFILKITRAQGDSEASA